MKRLTIVWERIGRHHDVPEFVGCGRFGKGVATVTSVESEVVA